MKCPCCGGAELVREKRDLPFSYRDKSTIICDVEGDYCNACGDGLLGAESTYSKQASAFIKQVKKASKQ